MRKSVVIEELHSRLNEIAGRAGNITDVTRSPFLFKMHAPDLLVVAQEIRCCCYAAFLALLQIPTKGW